MINVLVIFLSIFMAQAASSEAAALDKRELSACYSIYEVSASAVENMTAGVTKEQLIAPLATRESLHKYPHSRNAEKILGLAMHDVADQIYGHESLGSRSYYAYSAEVCQRKLRGIEVPAEFNAVYPELLACKKEPSGKQIKCGMAVAGSK